MTSSEPTTQGQLSQPEDILTGQQQVILESNKGEGWILLAILLVYAGLSFFLLGPLSTHYDSPGYTDPAASYVMGQGFTSGCWYFQGSDEFWAGNVPLHQFLLIPWFKAFGFSSDAVRLLNILYIVLGIWMLWQGMMRSRLVSTSGLRLGMVAFFLASDSSFSLASSGRPEPLCFFIVCAAWYFNSLEIKVFRWGGIVACGLLAPWAGLHLAAFFAFAGIGALLFFQKRYFKEVVALAMGGVLGTLALVGFYKSMGAWDAFIANICPHISEAVLNPVQKTAAYTEWMAYVKARAWRLQGFTTLSILLSAILSLGLSIAGIVTGRSIRLAAFSIGCIVGLPLLFASLGAFPRYYGFYLLLPIACTLFALLSAGVARDLRGWRFIRFLPWLAVAVPGAYVWCIVVQAWPCFCSKTPPRICAFMKGVVHPSDVACVDTKLWFAAKPLARKTFAGLWRLQAKMSKERDEVTVVIAPDSKIKWSPAFWYDLPGEWKPTGEQLQIPSFNKFYRTNTNTPPILFEVYRRVDR